MERKIKTILAVAAIPAIALAWAAFRPELLFVNQTVTEAKASGAKTIAAGTFAGYAHETTGTVELLANGANRTLRLSGFSTSNGPDVRLYLVEGKDGRPEAVKPGHFVDLGPLKANRGDQNYTLPKDVDLAKYGAVEVWCARFSVGFGGATLKDAAKTTAFRSPFEGAQFHLASFGASETIVTSGTIRSAGGKASITEAGGGRLLRIAATKAPKGTRVLLLKKESLADGKWQGVSSVELGKLGSAAGSFRLSKEIDAWLYRSVALVSPDGKLVGSADLRSDQERKKTALFLNEQFA